MVELDKEQEKVFVNELMEANELKGASKKRLIKFLGAKYDWDSNSRSIILCSSKLSGIIPPFVVDFSFDAARRSTQYHKMFTKK